MWAGLCDISGSHGSKYEVLESFGGKNEANLV
jgi:hypothetical protein